MDGDKISEWMSFIQNMHTNRNSFYEEFRTGSVEHRLKKIVETKKKKKEPWNHKSSSLDVNQRNVDDHFLHPVALPVLCKRHFGLMSEYTV